MAVCIKCGCVAFYEDITIKLTRRNVTLEVDSFELMPDYDMSPPVGSDELEQAFDDPIEVQYRCMDCGQLILDSMDVVEEFDGKFGGDTGVDADYRK